MRTVSPIRLLLVTALVCLSACGQKGQLFLPQSPGEVVTRPTQTPATTTITTPAPTPAATPSLVAAVEEWRTQRLASLAGENGWLTLVALLPISEGRNGFGRAASNTLRINHIAVPAKAATFTLAHGTVTLDAARQSGITLGRKPVSHMKLTTDASGEPTVLALGPLRFFVIDRVGKLFLRVRDVQNPRRSQFQGIESFAIDADWNLTADFEPYAPAHQVSIMNILGLEQKMQSPGAIVFTKDGHSWRLDAIDEDPTSDALMVMFADGTTGHETYGAGRFLDVPRPIDGKVSIDFNRAYNPPCAFNDFATCPLPPPQNRLALRVEAGEKRYGH